MEVSENEMRLIYGGNGFGIFAGVSAAIAFLISVVEGFLNPRGCGE